MVLVLNEQQLNILVLRTWVLAGVAASRIVAHIRWLLPLGPSVVLFEAPIEVFDLGLKIVDLTHVYALVKKVLPLYLIVVHHVAVGALPRRRVVALRLLLVLVSLIFLLILLDLNLLLVVLAHYRHRVAAP